MHSAPTHSAPRALLPPSSWPLFVVLALAISGSASAVERSHIRGLITGETGNPLAGALVTAFYGGRETPPPLPPGPPGLQVVARTRTGDDGRFDLEIDEPGCFFVRALAAGYQAVFYPGVVDVWEATCVEVRGGDVVSGIDIGLLSAGAIAGRITDARTGEPIAGARVMAWPAFTDTAGGIPPDGGDLPPDEDPPGDWGGDRTLTDETGAYLIDGLAAGTYLVQAEADGYIAEFYDDTQNPEEADLVTVEPPETVFGIDLALGRGGCIHGRVTDQATGAPIAGAYVSLGGRGVPPAPAAAP